MKRNVVLNAAAGACLFLPMAMAHAQEKEPATIRLSHGVLRYGMVSEESKLGSQTEEKEASGFVTFPQGIEIAVYWKGYAVYALPVSQGGSLVLSKAIGSNMEAGVSATINSNNIKDGNEFSNNSLGGYFFYTAPISPMLNFEFDFNPALLMGDSKTLSGANPPVEETGELSGYMVYLDLLGVVPLAKNFEYVFGIDYTMQKFDIKNKENGISTTTEYNIGNLGLILAKFRYFI